MTCLYCTSVKGASDTRCGLYCRRFWHLLPVDLCLACLVPREPAVSAHISEHPCARGRRVLDEQLALCMEIGRGVWHDDFKHF